MVKVWIHFENEDKTVSADRLGTGCKRQKGVQVFASTELSFSINGKDYRRARFRLDEQVVFSRSGVWF